MSRTRISVLRDRPRRFELEAIEPVVAVLEGLPDATVASARDGRIVFVNALAAELFGYAREDLVGRPVSTLWPERLRDRYTRNMNQYRLSASIGIALGREDPQALLAGADAAVYRAKAAGRGRVEIACA
jgi:PAS domain-containing protein